jgi:D-alanyl-D-alanine carboxypeptidase/D-alanyl-D-alanine-endopeptidase (penicillin-binding protein 4)
MELLRVELLKDTIHQEIKLSNGTEIHCSNQETLLCISLKQFTQPVDSLFLMMHRSDNFFADQVLLMVSNERLGIMKDNRIVDTLLKTDFKGFPEPRWVDGSGLSSYNLFTPMDIVWLLDRMKTEIPWQRITNILPTGGEGTLRNYYTSLKGNLYGKTGTLASHVALSGYLTTAKGKSIIFSILVNNHNTSSTQVRRAVKISADFSQKLTSVYSV